MHLEELLQNNINWYDENIEPGNPVKKTVGNYI